jgi:hypothetical protein
MSLQDFITTNHEKLVSMTREKVAKRSKNPRPDDLETRHGVHVFLDQLREALVAEAKRDPANQAEADPPTNPNIAKTATLHGHDLLGLGFSVDEVVHDYGDVCQAVTELAVELDAPISVADFHTLNRCLDNAIASAVTAWTGDRETDVSAKEGQRASKDERLRRLVSGSITIFDLVRAGKVGSGGSAAMVLGQNLEKCAHCWTFHCRRWSPRTLAPGGVDSGAAKRIDA